MVSTEDLDAWIDPSIDDIKRFMFMYGKTKDPAHLADALLSAEVLHAIIDAVHTRVAPK